MTHLDKNAEGACWVIPVNKLDREKLETRIQALAGVFRGPLWGMSCTSYTEVLSREEAVARKKALQGQQWGQSGAAAGRAVVPTKNMVVVKCSDMPRTCYSNVGGSAQILRASLEFEEVLEKLAGMYKRKSKCEIKGSQYRTSDFVFKVGTLTDQKGGTRGLLLELTYLPCVVEEQCSEVLLEMATNLLMQPPEELATILNRSAVYTREQTVHQHLELLRKKKLI